MAKKSKKRARQAVRRAQRRMEKKDAVPLDARSRLLKRIFNEARDRHQDAAHEGERLREEEARREARARARGHR